MDRKIGKNIQVLFLLVMTFVASLSCNNSSVTLSLQDLEQNSIRQVEIGVPFILQVSINNVQKPQMQDEIQGIDNFEILQKFDSTNSTSLSVIVNGKLVNSNQSQTFNYVLRAHKKGVYKFGPITVKGENNILVTSSVLSVEVGDRTVVEKVRKQQYFLQVELPKKVVYVGEKVEIKIRFYYMKAFDGIKIIHPELEKFHVDIISEQPVDGEENIDGTQYKYKEWSMSVYPESVGIHLIPQMQAVFHAASASMNVFDFLNFSNERIVQSVPRSIEVKSLPESNEYQDVSAVGTFDQARFTLQHDRGDIGQGLVAMYSIRGRGNFSFMKAPKIQLPKGLNYYESNSSVKKIDEENFEKTFEYIIQGEHAGEYSIQPQIFVYFEPQKEIYKALKTNSVTLKIIGENVTKEVEASSKEGAAHIKGSKKYVFKDGQINFIQEVGFSLENSSASLMQRFLTWLIQVLSLLSLLAALYWIYVSRFLGIVKQSSCLLSIQVYLLAYKAYYQKSVKAFYELFSMLIKQHGFNDLQQQNLKEIIIQHSLNDLKQWEDFVHDMMTELFSGQQDSNQKKKILQQALVWIKELQNCFRKKQKLKKVRTS